MQKEAGACGSSYVVWDIDRNSMGFAAIDYDACGALFASDVDSFGGSIVRGGAERVSFVDVNGATLIELCEVRGDPWARANLRNGSHDDAIRVDASLSGAHACDDCCGDIEKRNYRYGCWKVSVNQSGAAG